MTSWLEYKDTFEALLIDEFKWKMFDFELTDWLARVSVYGTGLAYIVKAKFPQKSLKPTLWRAAGGLHEVKKSLINKLNTLIE